MPETLLDIVLEFVDCGRDSFSDDGPLYFDDYGTRCYFCQAELKYTAAAAAELPVPSHVVEHLEDCLWLRAKRLLQEV